MYVSIFLIRFIVGLLLGIGCVSVSNFVYRFKGKQYVQLVRLTIIIFAAIGAIEIMSLLDQLDFDENDYLLAFTPLVSMFIGLIGWASYLEKTGKALWKADGKDSSSNK